jgi:hypothetical protein
VAGISSMYSVFSALHAERQAYERRQRNTRERAYLRSLQWTDGQLAAFDRRVSGIHARADRVLYGAPEKPPYAGVQPPRPWPRTSPDWCPTCTKPYAECRCNGVAR